MEVQSGQRTRGFLIGLCEADEIKNLQNRQVLPVRPPPNKFEGATLGFIKLEGAGSEYFGIIIYRSIILFAGPRRNETVVVNHGIVLAHIDK
jgi:hypothetical protein